VGAVLIEMEVLDRSSELSREPVEDLLSICAPGANHYPQWLSGSVDDKAT
jgi:hypothetical protein